MSKMFRGFLIPIGIIFSIVGGLYLFLHVMFGKILTGPFYDKKDLISNYELRNQEIADVRNYFKSILPSNTNVTIEFRNDKELEIFHVDINNNHQNNWDLEVDSPKVDSLLSELKWTKKKLETLKDKLDKANCISIEGTNPVTIGWKRSGMGKFSYNFFEQNLEKDKINGYNDGCTYIFYKDNIVLEYGGGAIGSQCFPDYYSNKTKKSGL